MGFMHRILGRVGEMICLRRGLVIATFVLLSACGSRSAIGTGDIDTRSAPSDVTPRQTDGVGDVVAADYRGKPDVADVPMASMDATEVMEIVPDHSEAVDSGPDQVDVVDALIEIVDSFDSSDGLLDTLHTGDICIPDCDGIECGDDGCGGTCGECEGPQEQCVDGQCECQPDCEGKQCGQDGCGGVCADCPGENDLCVEGLCNCIPDCACSECGDDGCGGLCGQCSEGGECMVGSCVGGKCEYEAVVGPGCCSVDEECDDDDICTGDHCIGNVCLNKALAECCHTNADCPPAGQCGVATCYLAGHYCVEVPKSIEGQKLEGLECCLTDEDCRAGGIWEEDGDGDGKPGPDHPGTLDYCSAGVCKHVTDPGGCECQDDWQCDDGMPCSVAMCADGCACVYDNAECCVSNYDCMDENHSTFDSCVTWAGDCVHYAMYCSCSDDGECDDSDPCTDDLCIHDVGEGACCFYTAVDGCYVSDSDCD